MKIHKIDLKYIDRFIIKHWIELTFKKRCMKHYPEHEEEKKERTRTLNNHCYEYFAESFSFSKENGFTRENI